MSDETQAPDLAPAAAALIGAVLSVTPRRDGEAERAYHRRVTLEAGSWARDVRDLAGYLGAASQSMTLRRCTLRAARYDEYSGDHVDAGQRTGRWYVEWVEEGDSKVRKGRTEYLSNPFAHKVRQVTERCLHEGRPVTIWLAYDTAGGTNTRGEQVQAGFRRVVRVEPEPDTRPEAPPEAPAEAARPQGGARQGAQHRPAPRPAARR